MVEFEGVQTGRAPSGAGTPAGLPVRTGVFVEYGRPPLGRVGIHVRRVDDPSGSPGEYERWLGVGGFSVHLSADEDSSVVAHVARQGEWLTQSLPPQPGSMQLRLIARPDASLDVSVLFAARATTASAARKRANEVSAVMYAAAGVMRSTISLRPLATASDVAARLAFPRKGGAFVELRHATVPYRDGRMAVAALVASPLSQLTAMLSHEAHRLQRPIGVITTLVAEETSACADPGCTLCQDPAAIAVRESGCVPARSPASTRLVRVQSVVTSPGPVSWAVVEAAVAESAIAGRAPDGHHPLVAEDVVHPRELELLSGAVGRLEVCDWERAHSADRGLPAPADGPHGPRVVEVQQALALARFPLASQGRAPRERWISAGTGPVGIVLGQNVAGGAAQPVRITDDDLRRHVYICGSTGSGKSTLMKNMALQAMRRGQGFVVVDPHGDLVDELTALVPDDRIDDVILLDPLDTVAAPGLNVLDCPTELQPYAVENFIGMLYTLFDPTRQGIVGPRFEHAVRNAMHLAMAAPDGGSLLEVVRILTDNDYVRSLVQHVTDPMVLNYWTRQIPSTSDFHRSETLDYIVSKFSRFTHDPRLRRIVGQLSSSFSFREAMDDGRIVLIRLAQGLLGEETSRFLGMSIVNMIAQAAYSRVDLPVEKRSDFLLFVDEFQAYASPTFTSILSGARKYGLSLVLANQHVRQLPTELAQAVFGNVASLVSFRLGVEDAPLVASAMSPGAFQPEDYQRLPNFHAIATLLRDGEPIPAFSMVTQPAPRPAGAGQAARVIGASRAAFGRPVEQVDAGIAARFGLSRF